MMIWGCLKNRLYWYTHDSWPCNRGNDDEPMNPWMQLKTICSDTPNLYGATGISCGSLKVENSHLHSGEKNHGKFENRRHPRTFSKWPPFPNQNILDNCRSPKLQKHGYIPNNPTWWFTPVGKWVTPSVPTRLILLTNWGKPQLYNNV